MFCSSCKRINPQLTELKQKICDGGHIFCKLCEKDTENCIICDQKIMNYIHVEINENIPKLSYSSIHNIPLNKQNSIELETNETDESDFSDESVKEIFNKLNQYENCCDKIECEKKPIIGCVQVIGHLPNDSSLSMSIDEEDEKEMLKNFCGKTTETPEVLKTCNTSEKSTDTRHKNKSRGNLIKSSHSIAIFDHDSSLIVNKSSTREILSESRNSCISLSSRSECFNENEKVSIIRSDHSSVHQIFKNEKATNDSELANFTSLSSSRLEASPPENKNDSKIPSNACRAKFNPVYHCDHNYPAQMEPIEYFDVDNDETNEMLEKVALSLPRLPVTCPCSFCGMVTTPTDFFSHITIDHPNIETVKLTANKVVNCTFCPSGNLNYVRCHRMFLLSGKLTDIGHGPFRNCLPILLLSCKFNLREIFGLSTLPNQRYQKSEEILCIWLSSVYQYPVKYTLDAWKHGRDKSEDSFIKSISTTSSCLNVKESNLALATSVLSLSCSEFQKVSNDNSMINCQISFN